VTVFELWISSQLTMGDVVEMLDRLSPRPAGPWLLDGYVEVRPAVPDYPSRLPAMVVLSGPYGLGPTSISVIRTLLLHDGRGRVGDQRRAWTAAEFELAVQVGGDDAVAFLREPSRA